MAFLLRNSVASHLQSHSQRAQNDSFSQSQRQFHVEPGPREKALLAADPSLKRFKSHKKGVSRVKRLGDVLTIVVIADWQETPPSAVYKKHQPPSLLGEVWRLEKIGKDGAFHKRLSQENINTLNDFLIQLFINPSRLRNILGTGMSAKMWEVTVEHAQTCTLEKRVYMYYPLSSQETSFWPTSSHHLPYNVEGHTSGLDYAEPSTPSPDIISSI